MTVLTESQAAKLLLVLASTVVLGSESHGTRDVILQSGGSESLQATLALTVLAKASGSLSHRQQQSVMGPTGPETVNDCSGGGRRQINGPGQRQITGPGQQQMQAKTNREYKEDQSILSSKRKPHFKTHKLYWDEHRYGRGSRRDGKERMSVLAKTSSKWRSRQ
jgi:hypothetical protein